MISELVKEMLYSIINSMISNVTELTGFAKDWFFDFANTTNTTTQFVSNALRFFVFDTNVYENFVILDSTFLLIKILLDDRWYSASLQKETQKDIIHNYYKLYYLDIISRYSIYFILSIPIYFIDLIVQAPNTQEALVFLKGIFFIITIPYIQNGLIKNTKLDDYINFTKEFVLLFTKYILSKIIIYLIEKLKVTSVKIQNYHIFILMNYLTVENVCHFCKSMLFIIFLNVLRNNDTTYYYYKAIKISYYYNSKYLFNVMSLDDARYLLNLIVQQKKWLDIFKIDAVNAIYTQITNNNVYNTLSDVVTLQFTLINFFSVWTIVTLLRIIDLKIKIIILLYSLFKNKSDQINVINNNTLHILIIYILGFLNMNEIVVSLIVISKDLVFHLFFEMLFIIKNYNNIKKTVEFYGNQE